MDMDIPKMTELAIQYGIQITGALVALIIGWWLIGWIVNGITKIVSNKAVDPTLKPVIISTSSLLLKVMLLLAIASTIGIKTTSFVAVLGAAGLAIGLAFQGSLANIAGGFLLLFFRPIEVEDYIKAQGVEGFVEEVTLFTTKLRTPDNQSIYIPNGTLANGNIINASQKGSVRLHLAIGIGYGENIGKAKDILLNVMQQNSMVLQTPAPQVAVVNLGDSSVDLDMRPWCKPIDAPAVTVTILEAAKIALDNANIEIPFPQRVVHQANS